MNLPFGVWFCPARTVFRTLRSPPRTKCSVLHGGVSEKKIDTEVSSPCSRWYHISKAEFNLGPIHVRFAVENVALEQGSLRLPWVFSTNIFPETLHSDLYFKTFVWRKSGRKLKTFKESNALSDLSIEQWTERRFRMVSYSERYFGHSFNKTTVETWGHSRIQEVIRDGVRAGLRNIGLSSAEKRLVEWRELRAETHK